MKILFVDDDEHVRWMTQTVLESLGHQVSVFASGDEVLASLKEEEPDIDCFLLDRNMPGMGGLDLLRQIRLNASYKESPIVFLTSSSSPEEVAEGLAAGAQLYLSKPAPKKLLKAALNQITQMLEERRDIRQNLSETRLGLALADHMSFKFQTMAQARQLSALLASMTSDPDRTSLGFAELLFNAVEHGNLEISYEEKSKLLEGNLLHEEIQNRLESDTYKDRFVEVKVWREASSMRVKIEDQGPGFDWRPFMDFDPERAFDLHGRGIAISNKMAFDELVYLGRGNVVELVSKLDNQSAEVSEECIA